MIIFNVLQNDHQIAEKIANHVIKNKFALSVHIDTNEMVTEKGTIQTIRLFFVTKALLFDTIENSVVSKFALADMVIYATPVLQLSKRFGDELRAKLKAV